MTYLSVGLPSRFAEWCDGILCALVQAARGSFDSANANSLGELALAWIKARSDNLVIGARQPSDDLRTALIETGRRFVVALDDPRAAFRYLVATHGFDWREATRATAASCAAMLNFTTLPGALVLRANRVGRVTPAAAAAIAGWLDLDLDTAAIAAVLAMHPGTIHPDADAELESWWQEVSPTDRAIVEGALKGYADCFGGGPLGQMLWSRDLFYLGDNPGGPATRAIDLSGPVRYLLFGPYMTVPPGHWHATVVLAVSRGAIGMSNSVEILAGSRFEILARSKIEPRGEGICETTLQFTVAPSTPQPIELRLCNARDAYTGRLALGHVVLSPQLATRREIPAELTIALGL